MADVSKWITLQLIQSLGQTDRYKRVVTYLFDQLDTAEHLKYVYTIRK